MGCSKCKKKAKAFKKRMQNAKVKANKVKPKMSAEDIERFRERREELINKENEEAPVKRKRSRRKRALRKRIKRRKRRLEQRRNKIL
jgi:hypothetical protein